MNGVRVLVFASLALTVAASGCTGPESANVVVDVGSMGIALTLPGGTTLEEILYSITRSGSSYSKSGSIPVSGDGTSFSAQVDGIPAAKGYSLALHANASDGRKCSGSAKFEVTSGATTTVAIWLSCPGRSSRSETGSALINGELNLCAVVESVSAVPAGSSLELRAFASDDDHGPSAMRFAWSTASGKGLGTGEMLTLDCSALDGRADLVLKVSDGDCGDEYAFTLPQGTCSLEQPVDPVVAELKQA